MIQILNLCWNAVKKAYEEVSKWDLFPFFTGLKEAVLTYALHWAWINFKYYNGCSFFILQPYRLLGC